MKAALLIVGLSWGFAAFTFQAGDTAVPLGLPADLLERDGANRAQVELGRMLFFDPMLSIDSTVSCASCHDPDKGFASDVALSPGVNGHKTLRNAPTLLNRALGSAFMWDGRAATLEEQVLLPIVNEREMGLTIEEAIARLSENEKYVTAFERAFREPPNESNVASSLAAFVRRLLHGGTRVDRFQAGEGGTLTAEEKAGLWLFESKGGCWRCHSGPNFSDESFHNTGIGAEQPSPDLGRLAITGEEADRGAFKTPTLRALELTAPYMHDGSLATLEEVIEFYRKGGTPNPGLDPRVTPLDLSDEDVRHLLAFLKALSQGD